MSPEQTALNSSPSTLATIFLSLSFFSQHKAGHVEQHSIPEETPHAALPHQSAPPSACEWPGAVFRRSAGKTDMKSKLNFHCLQCLVFFFFKMQYFLVLCVSNPRHVPRYVPRGSVKYFPSLWACVTKYLSQNRSRWHRLDKWFWCELLK